MKPLHKRLVAPRRLRSRAERMLDASPRKLARMPANDVQKLLHELQVHQIELEMQNDELRRTQREAAAARDRYADLYDFAPAAHLTLGAQGEILEANLAVGRLLGLERARLINQKFTRFIASKAQDTFYLFCRRVFGSRARQSTELELASAKSGRLVVQMEASRSPTSPRTQLRVSFADITGRKLAEEELSRSEERYRTLIEQSPDGLFVTDAGASRIIDVNSAACRMFGHTREECLRLSILDVLAAGEAERLPVEVSRLSSGETEFSEWRLRRKDGSVFPGEIRARQLADGRLQGFVRDLTEPRRAEAALRESEERFRQVTEAIEQVFWMTDAARTKMLHVSPAYERIWGRTCQSLYDAPNSWLEAVQPEDRPKVRAAATSGRNDGKFDLEYRIRRPDGSLRWIHDRAFPIHDAAGKVQRIAGVADDITERQRMEEELRRNEYYLSNFFENAPIGLVWLSASGVILRANQAQLDLLGCSPDEYVGRFFSESCLEPQAVRGLLTELAARRTVRNLRLPLRASNGLVRHVLADAVSFWSENRFEYSSVFLRDITDRVQLEKGILEISEREHRHIAHDLHDGLGQLLVGTTYLVSTLQKDLAAQRRPEARRAARITKLLNEAITQSRNLARGLHPVELETNGLMASLKSLARRTKSLFQIKCRFICRKPVLVHDNAIATHLYRIAQEAITNSIKHGRPGRIEIGLTATPERISLVVKDDGSGIPGEHRRKHGMGLRIMRYRAGVIGGSLAIQKEAVGGTAVVCTVHLTGGGADVSDLQRTRAALPATRRVARESVTRSGPRQTGRGRVDR